MARYLLFLIVILALKSTSLGCSLFVCQTKNGPVVGRNFDYLSGIGKMTLFRRDPIFKSHAHAVFYQYGRSLPYGGVNDHGVFVGIAALESSDAGGPGFDVFRASSSSLGVVKTVLEKATNTEDAVALLKDRNILFMTVFGMPVLHYMISDRSGKSVVVEYVDGKCVVKDHDVLTNFRLDKAPLMSLSPIYYRYNLIQEANRNGVLESSADVRDMLENVAQKKDVMPMVTSIFDTNKDYSVDDIYIQYIQPLKTMLPDVFTQKLGEGFDDTIRYRPIEIADQSRKMGLGRAETLWSYVVNLKTLHLDLFIDRDYKREVSLDLPALFKSMESHSETYVLDWDPLYDEDPFPSELTTSTSSWQNPRDWLYRLRQPTSDPYRLSIILGTGEDSKKAIAFDYLWGRQNTMSYGIGFESSPINGFNGYLMGGLAEFKWLDTVMFGVGLYDQTDFSEHKIRLGLKLAWEPNDFEICNPYLMVRYFIATGAPISIGLGARF